MIADPNSPASRARELAELEARIAHGRRWIRASLREAGARRQGLAVVGWARPEIDPEALRRIRCPRTTI
jgi:hypothetical protein